MARPARTDELEVFFVDLDAVTRAVALPTGVLADDERARAARFAFSRDRDEFTIGRLGLRLLIAERLAVAPAAVDLVVGQGGAPELRSVPEPPVRFNVSHAGGLIAFVRWTHGAAGIDIEAAARLVDDRDLAASILSPTELVVYEATPLQYRQSLLLRSWTAKEAFLKALRIGLTRDPRSISVGRQVAAARHDIEIDGRRWTFHRLDAGREWEATLATDVPDAVVSVRWWTDTMVARLAELGEQPGRTRTNMTKEGRWPAMRKTRPHTTSW